MKNMLVKKMCASNLPQRNETTPPYWNVLLVLRITGLFHPYVSRLDTLVILDLLVWWLEKVNQKDSKKTGGEFNGDESHG